MSSGNMSSVLRRLEEFEVYAINPRSSDLLYLSDWDAEVYCVEFVMDGAEISVVNHDIAVTAYFNHDSSPNLKALSIAHGLGQLQAMRRQE